VRAESGIWVLFLYPDGSPGSTLKRNTDVRRHKVWRQEQSTPATPRKRILRLAAAGAVVLGTVVVPASAFAASCDYAGGNCGTASSVPTPTTAVSSRSSDNGGLPFTGGDVVGLSLIGIGAVAGGTALVRSGRRKAVGG
jgi:hypothetical protein